jgi:hypothetical protein
MQSQSLHVETKGHKTIIINQVMLGGIRQEFLQGRERSFYTCRMLLNDRIFLIYPPPLKKYICTERTRPTPKPRSLSPTSRNAISFADTPHKVAFAGLTFTPDLSATAGYNHKMKTHLFDKS